MDIRKVKKLIELLEESNLNEIEVTEGDDSVRISRGSSEIPAPAVSYSLPVSQPPQINPNEGKPIQPESATKIGLKFFLQWSEHFMLLQHPAPHLSSRKERKYRQVMFCALSRQ